MCIQNSMCFIYLWNNRDIKSKPQIKGMFKVWLPGKKPNTHLNIISYIIGLWLLCGFTLIS